MLLRLSQKGGIPSLEWVSAKELGFFDKVKAFFGFGEYKLRNIAAFIQTINPSSLSLEQAYDLSNAVFRLNNKIDQHNAKIIRIWVDTLPPVKIEESPPYQIQQEEISRKNGIQEPVAPMETKVPLQIQQRTDIPEKEAKLERAAQSLNEQLESQGLRMKEDPLTIRQQLKIKEFIDGYMLKQKHEGAEYTYGNTLDAFEPKSSHSILTMLSKKYMRTDPGYSFIIKSALFGEKAKSNPQEVHQMLQKLEAVIDNPALLSEQFEINPNDRLQIFAAKTFIKAALKNCYASYSHPSSHYTFVSVHESYRSKMAGRGNLNSDPISRKNRLLIENDPVIHPKEIKTDLELILANTYFETPVVQWTMIVNGINTIYAATTNREVARDILKKTFQELFTMPALEPIMRALAALIRREKAQIFISGFPESVGALGAPYKITTTTFGFYARHHSLFVKSLINPRTNSIENNAKGTIIHEIQHLLYALIVKNGCSPFKSGSEEEKIYTKALLADIEYRKTVDMKKLSPDELSVWKSLVTDLEENNFYFGGKPFDPNNEIHMHTMHVEAIVRPWEQKAMGISDETIKNIAPNLWGIVNSYSKKIFHDYASPSA